MKIQKWLGICLVIVFAAHTAHAQMLLNGTIRRGRCKINENGEFVASYYYKIQTDAEKIRTPIVRALALIKEEDGSKSLYIGIEDDIKGVKAAVNHFETDAKMEAVSMLQDFERIEVFREKVRQPKLRVGRFFDDKEKVLLSRLELWVNGKRLDVHKSYNRLMLKLMGIPEDWYEWGKYPELMSYPTPGQMKQRRDERKLKIQQF